MYFFLQKKDAYFASSSTSSKITFKASSPLRSSNFRILVYQPFLLAYLTAKSSNTFLTAAVSFSKNAKAFLLDTKEPFFP